MKRHANLSIFVPHNGCPRQCIFCNQNRISGENHTPTAAEVAALCDRYLPQKDESGHTEIAFFGGSFTAIDRALQESLLQAAYPFVASGRASGIRLSTRPDAIDRDILDMLYSYQVKAIELGAQSMDDEVLLLNRRGHSAEDVERASELIKSYKNGVFSLGLQMMIGMYGEKDSETSALLTAQRFVAMKPETVRIYPTIVVQNTPLCDEYNSGNYQPLSVHKAAEITAKLLVLFEQANINVIRVGLHSDESLRNSAVAGPFHPAFGELCYSLVMREKIENAMNDDAVNIKIAVNPKAISRAKGLSLCNVQYFASKGMQIAIVADETVPMNEIRRIET